MKMRAKKFRAYFYEFYAGSGTIALIPKIPLNLEAVYIKELSQRISAKTLNVLEHPYYCNMRFIKLQLGLNWIQSKNIS